MPCDTVQMSRVEFGQKTDIDLLVAALRELRLSPRIQGKTVLFGNRESIDCETGRANVMPFRDLREIKRAYSKQVVVSQAAKFGFKVAPLEGRKEVVRVRV